MAGDVVLVTGATGFVGSAVARQLAERGFKVRALVRRSSPRANLEGVDLEPVEGDMLDKASMRRALDGARYLFHVAADYRLWAKDPQEIIRNNLKGTGAVMDAALEAGVERLVYTSSVATLKPRTDGVAVDETAPADMLSAVGAYKKSKTAAERLVERMVADQGLPAVIVNPSTPIGPRDIKPTPTGKMIRDAALGRMPAYVDTGLNIVHVDDVAEGHVLALERGEIGERYILGGEDYALGTLFAEVARQAGRAPPRLRLPIGPLVPLALACEALARFGVEPLVTRETLAMARKKMFFSHIKAGEKLGYRPRPAADAIRDAVAWFLGPRA